MSFGFRLNQWTVRPDDSYVSEGSNVHALERKHMQLLVLLCQHPGQVVSYEMIQTTIWPQTGKWEASMRRAVSVLRKLLNDSVKPHQLIQTRPKEGYVLNAVVEVLTEPEPEGKETASSQDVTEAPPQPSAEPKEAWPTVVLNLRLVQRYSRLALLVLALIGLGIALLLWRPWLFWSEQDALVSPGTQVFIERRGMENHPTLSHAGTHFAFIGRLNKRDPYKIHLASLEKPTESRQLTHGEGADLWPCFSPDDQRLAFARLTYRTYRLMTVDIANGAEKDLPLPNFQHITGLTYAPDRDLLILSGSERPDFPITLKTYDSKLNQLKELTRNTSPAGLTPQTGDMFPTISPDGERVGFIRKEGDRAFLCEVSLEGGPVRILGPVPVMVTGLTWNSRGNGFFYSTYQEGLWYLRRDGLGPPRQLVEGGPWAMAPWARKGLLAFQQVGAVESLCWLDFEQGTLPQTLIEGHPWVGEGQYSQDGRWLAYVREEPETGNRSIWLSESDGRNPHLIREMGGTPIHSLAWSPRHLLAFQGVVARDTDLFWMHREGFPFKHLALPESDEVEPFWVGDEWLYFGSNQNGTWNLWRYFVDGEGLPEPVTDQGGYKGLISPDGQILYYLKHKQDGLFARAIDGGDERQVIPQLLFKYADHWAVREDGVFFLRQVAGQLEFVRYAFETGHQDVLAHLPRTVGTSPMALHPIEPILLYSNLDSATKDIMIVGEPEEVTAQ